MGLLFQPRWCGVRPGSALAQAGSDIAFDRGHVFLAALEAVVLGDASRFVDLFTDDVVFTSPHLAVDSLSSLQQAVGSPEDSLSDVILVVVALDDVETTR